MMQSEFYERTKVNLEPEEYIKIETLYNEVEMDKDQFCKEWLKLRNNPLMRESIDAFYKSQRMVFEIARLEKELDEAKKMTEKVIENTTKKLNDDMENFAKRIILANCGSDHNVEDIIEEEYDFAFIIKTKHEAGIPLNDAEISYMVGKL